MISRKGVRGPYSDLSPSKRVSLLAMLTALSVSSNYALIWIPNVKLMDLLVFVAGFVAGPIDGALVGAMSWAVYGYLNPYGWVPTIFIATLLSEAIYGVVGGLIRGSLTGRAELALIGLLCTIAYDLLTNIAFALTFRIPVLIALVAGIPFALIHELSNSAIFALLAPELIRFLRKIFARKD